MTIIPIKGLINHKKKRHYNVPHKQIVKHKKMLLFDNFSS